MRIKTVLSEEPRSESVDNNPGFLNFGEPSYILKSPDELRRVAISNNPDTFNYGENPFAMKRLVVDNFGETPPGRIRNVGVDKKPSIFDIGKPS
ncbi:unnamed protein product [Gongylonema pulchrum]|uniref:Catalase n=1 Tax=Gongylonema pulchrum TaxID=637853 RepID=A0A183CZM3_9BILA|nr:unnamed protein product [Gongylonema pulchrum]